jgi:hypothetical protein
MCLLPTTSGTYISSVLSPLSCGLAAKEKAMSPGKHDQ